VSLGVKCDHVWFAAETTTLTSTFCSPQRGVSLFLECAA
jgi:hypothetical protein